MTDPIAVRSLRATAERGLAWTTLSTLVVRLATVGVTFYIATVLAASEYGVLAAAMVAVGAIWMLNDFGFGSAVVQHRGDRREITATALVTVISVGAVAAVVVYILAAEISELLSQPGTAALLRVLSLAVVLRATAVVPLALLDQGLRFKQRSMLEMLGAGCHVLTALVLIGGLRRGAVGVAWAHVVQSLVTSLGAWILAPRDLLGRPSWLTARRLWNVAKNVLAGGIIAYLATNLDNLFLSRATTAATLGGYVLAYATANLPAVQMADVAGRVLFPVFVNLRDHPERIAAAYTTSLTILLRTSLPLFLLISILGPHLIQRFLGNGWSAASAAIQILPIFGAIRVISGVGGPLLLATGRSAAIVRTGVFGLSAQALLLWLLVVRLNLGSRGASIAVSAASALTLYFIDRAIAPAIQMPAGRQLLWTVRLALPTAGSGAAWFGSLAAGLPAAPAIALALSSHIALTLATGGRRDFGELLRSLRDTRSQLKRG